jgi:energy-coupling factor transport system substrate-specific component
MHANAVPLNRRVTAVLAGVSLIGVALFTWPLFVAAEATAAGWRDAPFVFALLIALLLAVAASEVSSGGIDAKAIAVLGVLSAVGAALRPLGTGIAGFEPVFFLLILAGRVFGPGFGFLLGATTLFASALTTAGIGPWLPYQMLAAAWIGAGAGLLPACGPRRERFLLAGYAVVAALFYGLLLNLSFWPFVIAQDTAISYIAGAPLFENLTRFIVFTLVTSLGFDVPRAVLTAVLVAVTAPTVLRVLRRASRKAAFHAPVSFEP